MKMVLPMIKKNYVSNWLCSNEYGAEVFSMIVQLYNISKNKAIYMFHKFVIGRT